MKYSEPLRNQLDVFLVFLGVGFLLGLCYEVLVFLQCLLSRKNAAVLVRDLLFCFLAFTVLFCAFLGYTNGIWRLPLLLSGAAGFFVFEWSLGKYLRRLFLFVSSTVSRVLQTLVKPFSFAANRLLQTANKAKTACSVRMRAAKEKLKQKLVLHRQKKTKTTKKKQKNRAKIQNKT